MGSLTSPPRVEYESGGSAPTYAALDTARNDLDALNSRRFAMACNLKEIVARADVAVESRNRAYDQIDDLVSDLFFDRETEITNEIADLEDRLGDDA